MKYRSIFHKWSTLLLIHRNDYISKYFSYFQNIFKVFLLVMCSYSFSQIKNFYLYLVFLSPIFYSHFFSFPHFFPSCILLVSHFFFFSHFIYFLYSLQFWGGCQHLAVLIIMKQNEFYNWKLSEVIKLKIRVKYQS